MSVTDFMRLIGQRVRDRRNAIGLSQEALATAAGLHRTQINLIEHNKRKIRIETLLRLALALGVEPADLLPRLSEVGLDVLQRHKSRRQSEARKAVPRNS